VECFHGSFCFALPMMMCVLLFGQRVWLFFMNDREEQVILVDRNDKHIGLQDKLEAHVQGNLHRAVSLFVFNKNGQLLLQQRALTKYHSAGLWANTCCSHPRDHERSIDAAHRRLQEELGFDCALEEVFSFVYKTQLNENLWEHEFDHVFIGRFDGKIVPNPEEVAQVRWVDISEIRDSLVLSPELYAPWFPLCFEKAVVRYGG
jgi:isopentenyl-diphosphate Delta-isomerase